MKVSFYEEGPDCYGRLILPAADAENVANYCYTLVRQATTGITPPVKSPLGGYALDTTIAYSEYLRLDSPDRGHASRKVHTTHTLRHMAMLFAATEYYGNIPAGMRESLGMLGITLLEACIDHEVERHHLRSR